MADAHRADRGEGTHDILDVANRFGSTDRVGATNIATARVVRLEVSRGVGKATRVVGGIRCLTSRRGVDTEQKGGNQHHQDEHNCWGSLISTSAKVTRDEAATVTRCMLLRLPASTVVDEVSDMVQR